jgi:hypothetical protein
MSSYCVFMPNGEFNYFIFLKMKSFSVCAEEIDEFDPDRRLPWHLSKILFAMSSVPDPDPSSNKKIN